jgi:hypothetical protein
MAPVRRASSASGPTRAKVAEVRTRKNEFISRVRHSAGARDISVSMYTNRVIQLCGMHTGSIRTTNMRIHVLTSQLTVLAISTGSSPSRARRAIRAARAMMPRTAHTWSPGTLAHNSVSRISGRGLVAL